MIYEIFTAAVISFFLIILGLFLGFLLLRVQGE